MRLLLVNSLAVMTALACAAQPSPPPQPGPLSTATPIATATPTAQPRPSPTPTLIPTQAAPTPTPTATPPVDVSSWKSIIWVPINIHADFDVTDAMRWHDGFLAVGWRGTKRGRLDGGVVLSEDGLEWERVRDDAFNSAELWDVAELPSGLAAWGLANRDESATTQPVLTSSDGRQWQRHDLPGHVWISHVGDRLIGWQKEESRDLAEWISDDGLNWRSQSPVGLDPSTTDPGWTIDTRFGALIYQWTLPEPTGRQAAAYVSTDRGETWSSFVLPDGADIQRVEAGPRGAYAVGESFQFPANPPVWRTMDGSTWERTSGVAFPELGWYDGTYVLDFNYCVPWVWDWPDTCAVAMSPSAPVGISTDGVSALEIPSFAGDRSLFGTWFGYFGPAVLGKPGILAVGGVGSPAWLGQPSTDPNPPELTFPPPPTPQKP
jgi:hypothetical protein